MADKQYTDKPPWKRKSLFFPLLLLSAGVILMLNTLGIIEGDISGILIRIWPVVFIVGGLDALYQRHGYVWGIVSIGIGTALLLINLGYLTINVWDFAFRFWPVLLIAWGLDLVIGKRTLWSALVGIVLGLSLIAGITWLAVNHSNLPGDSNRTNKGSYSLNPVNTPNVDIDAQIDQFFSSFRSWRAE